MITKFGLCVAICATLLTFPTVQMAQAGVLGEACIRSDRKAKSFRKCRCIQQVADVKLSRSDQKLAAKFFSEPDRAEKIRMSDKRSDERFWKSYKEFGATVTQFCAKH